MRLILYFFIISLFQFKLHASYQPDSIFQDGEVKLVNIENLDVKEEDLKRLKVKIFNLSFSVFKLQDNKLYTLIASPLGATSGDYNLEVFKDKELIKEFKVTLKTRENIETEEILYAPEINVLPKETELVRRVSEEDLELKNLLMTKSESKKWTGEFLEPVSAKINSHFGLYRVYSKHLRRRTHWGVDYHVPIGTKVKASSDGVVVLAKDMYFPGKTVVVDHGLGLYTGYSHLSKMTVKVGDKIKKGQTIGNSGVSGKVTGAHLHWFGVNSRVKFDPLTLLNLKEIK